MGDDFIGGLARTRVAQRDACDRPGRSVAPWPITNEADCIAPITTVRDQLGKTFLIYPRNIRGQNTCHVQDVVGIDKDGHGLRCAVSHECAIRGPACNSRGNMVQ